MNHTADQISRRKFLALSGAIAGTTLVDPQSKIFAGNASAITQNAVKTKVAVVGLGNRGTGMGGCDIVKEYGDRVAYVGLCDHNPGRLEVGSRMIGANCPTYTNFEKMMREARPDQLIITTDDLMGTAQTLADYRSDLRSQVIDIEDIYDEFNFGNANPNAVRDFLNYAKSKWRTAPRYVVLAGDGNYDYKNVQGEVNPIPPMMANTPSGLFPTDSWFGSREEVSQTEIAVGRLPVTTNAELAEVIRKIIAREAALAEPWLHSALLLADNADDGGDYAASSEAVAATLPADLPVVRGYFESQGVDESRIRLLDALNAGTGYVSYFGHGGFDQLADESLFTSVDAPLLTNAQRPAIMTAMTCLAGSSGLPGYSSLGEVLVRQQDGGAAALWAPSGMSENHLAQPMATEFYRAAFDPSVVRLGDAIRTARKAYRQSERPAFMLDLYNLLGDPAMRIR